MNSQNNISNLLNKHALIPVVSFESNDDPMKFVEFLMKQGISCIEVTLRNEHAFDAIRLIKAQQIENFDIGVGTVISPKQIDELISIGVDFMVSPALQLSLIEKLKQSGIPFLPGVSTPSDIVNALTLNINYLKFFPAHLFGGKAALSTYASVFPDVKFCPTGGIGENDYQQYLNLSNVVSVGGSWIQKKYNEQL